MKSLSRLLLLVVACVAWAKSAAAAPPMTHALVHIKNESAAYATFYYSWGGKWKSEVIQKGGSLALSYPYDNNEKHSPTLVVRIDIDTQGRHIVEYTLAKGAAPDDSSPRFGCKYTIKQIPGTDTRFLEATSPKAQVNVFDKDSYIPTVYN